MLRTGTSLGFANIILCAYCERFVTGPEWREALRSVLAIQVGFIETLAMGIYLQVAEPVLHRTRIHPVGSHQPFLFAELTVIRHRYIVVTIASSVFSLTLMLHPPFMRALELLAFFDLPADPVRQTRTFSTVMKKKVSLAAAIIHNPALLVLDEPFEGIDPVAARDIIDALVFMASKGTTVLITSHILDTVERVCSDLGIIHNGRMLLECGMDEYNARTEDLLQHSATGSLRDLFVRLVGDHRRKPTLSFV